MTIAEIMFIKYSIYNEFNYDKQIVSYGDQSQSPVA